MPPLQIYRPRQPPSLPRPKYAPGKSSVCFNFSHQQVFYEGVLINPLPDQEGNKLQRPNSGFIQHNPTKLNTPLSPLL